MARYKKGELIPAVYDFIIDFNKANGFYPTEREIAEGLNTVQCSVRYAIQKLANDKKIERPSAKSRTFIIL